MPMTGEDQDNSRSRDTEPQREVFLTVVVSEAGRPTHDVQGVLVVLQERVTVFELEDGRVLQFDAVELRTAVAPAAARAAA